ncbi:scaffold protein involved in DNA repair [Halorubrum sp. 2020YC2]|uniref:scaffold protein involved in DNA repair n=1 Tax=Halorubrum sp. 2020YC2 TaxID=2836432 RepID=UPI001BE5CA9F|nr:scaffold protein involved in DNA repair [Halorubrum sp. 2020YC2]QWC18771.1 scaffold protein involved in DNA repair [Halorubrum sp. 2020YC2]
MSEDRSLDDFVPGDGDGGSEAEAADGSDVRDAADADAATATSTWRADGAACDRCGERVRRRWRDGDAFVCADCASW